MVIIRATHRIPNREPEATEMVYLVQGSTEVQRVIRMFILTLSPMTVSQLCKATIRNVAAAANQGRFNGMEPQVVKWLEPNERPLTISDLGVVINNSEITIINMTMTYHHADSGGEVPFFQDAHIDGSMNRFDTMMTAILETTLQVVGDLHMTSAEA